MLWLQLSAIVSLGISLCAAAGPVLWRPSVAAPGAPVQITRAAHATWIAVPLGVTVAILLWTVWRLP